MRPFPLRNSSLLVAAMAAVGAVGLFVPASSAGEPCSSTTLTCDSDVQVLSAPSGSCAAGSVRARFDLTVLRLDALALQFAYSRVETSDDYVVTGPPPGTSLSIVLRAMAVVSSGYGYGFGFGSAEVVVSEASAGSRVLFEDSAQRQEATLELTIPVTVGQPFHVAYSGWARGGTGDAFAEITGVQIAGLPPGSRVESCHGYAQDVPVPVLAVSWGSLKSRYR
jgi:hypothetical protein